MWFQALEFAFSCAVVNYIFYCGKSRTYFHQLQKKRIWYPIRGSAGTDSSVDGAPLLFRCSIQRHNCCNSKASAYKVSARASREKTAFCGARFDCQRKGEQESRFLKNEYELSLLFSSKKYTSLQYKKPPIQAPGTTFSTFSDEVPLEGGHGNCCRCVTLTGVHRGAHICLAKLLGL